MLTRPRLLAAFQQPAWTSPLQPNQISCRITEIKITIPNHNYTAPELRRQSTTYTMEKCRQSNQFWKREIAVSTGSSPINKSKPTERQSCKMWTRGLLTSRPRFYRSRLLRPHPCSPPDGHRSGVWKMITKSSSIYASMPLTDNYRLQDIFSGACGCTAESSDRANALELGKV